MERDSYGYAEGNFWHPECREHNDAMTAHDLGGHCSSDFSRQEDARENLKKLRRRIEDRLRKDIDFLYEVAGLDPRL